MRLHVATKEGTVTVDVPQEATSRDLTSRVLASASQEGTSPTEAARHYLVCDGRKLKDITGVSGQETPLLAQGVSDGSTLVMFKRRMPPTNPDVGQITHPSLEQIERVVRTEAERQGREVVAPAQPAESNRGIAPLETRLHDIMQALQNMSSQGLNDPEMQRHVTQALRTAARIPAGAEPPMNEEVVVPEPNPTHIAQLGDMGFSAAAARRALLLNRNAVNTAANYLLAHGGDGDIEAEPTEQELRQVYRARNVRLAQPRQVEAQPELLEQLTAMGFSEAGSRHALVRNDNNLDSALNLLTSMPPGWEPAPEPEPAPAAGNAEQSGDAAEAPAAGTDADEGSNAALPQAENEQPEAAENRASASGEQAAAESAGATSASTREAPGATEQAEAENADNSAAAVQAVTRAFQAALGAVEGEDDGPGLHRFEGMNQLLGTTERGGEAGDEEEENQGDGQQGAAGQEEEADGSDDELLAREDGEDYQVAQEDFLRRSEQLLDDISILDLQEGMRGIMSALGGGAGGVGAEDGNRMSGALPILSTGSGQGGIMDPLRLVDDMRWGNAFPGMLDGLDEDGDGGDLDEDDEFNDEDDDDGFHTETSYAEDEDDPDDDDAGEDEDQEDDMEEDEAEEDDDGIDNSAAGSVASYGSPTPH